MDNSKIALNICKDVIRVLDLQKSYFKHRDPFSLAKCKEAEFALRQKAEMGIRLFEEKIGPR